MTLKHVDLCSGIGGFSLGFEWAGLSQPILFCDTEKWCRELLHKHWPEVPITTDVKELANDPTQIPDCDILTAGYPCQPFSAAGKRKGTEDDRHIWPYIRKIVAHKRPSWVVFENVYGHISLGIDTVLSDLEAEGYATRTFVVPAAGVNARHKRDRLWIVGNAQHNGPLTAEVGRSIKQASNDNEKRQDETSQSQRTSECSDSGEMGTGTGTTDVADTDSLDRRPIQEPRQRQQESTEFGQPPSNGSGHVAHTIEQGLQGWLPGGSDTQRQGVDGHSGRSSTAHGQPTKVWWATEPNVGRVAHGIPKRVDRLKGLGNAIVPQIAMQIGLIIKEYIEKEKDEQ